MQEKTEILHQHFRSINHEILKSEIRKTIKDKQALELIERMINGNGDMPDSVGIPVGNLTSQLFANIYLNKLDQFVKHRLKAHYYIRYMDDFVILSQDINELRGWLHEIEDFIHKELKLELNLKTTILCCNNGVDFVGYRHRPTHRKVRRDSVKRMKRKIRKYITGKLTKEELQKSLQNTRTATT